MDLRQLTAITAVADTGTFSAAAERLHTVQSNISSHVARLERQLGATLFDRANGCLTEEGEVVVARARRIQSELEALAADVNALRHEVVGEVRIGVIGTVARWLVPPLHAALAKAHPGIHMIVVDASTTSLAPQLLSGSLGLAIVNLPVNDPDVTTMALFFEDMVAIVPTSHPLAKRRSLRIKDLEGLPLLLPPSGASYRTEIDRVAAASGITLSPAAEIDGVRLITSLAFDGMGAAIVPATAAPVRLAGAWTRVAIRGLPPRGVGVAHRRRGMLPAPARALLVCLRDVLSVEGAKQPGVHMAVEEESPAQTDGSAAVLAAEMRSGD